MILNCFKFAVFAMSNGCCWEDWLEWASYDRPTRTQMISAELITRLRISSKTHNTISISAYSSMHHLDWSVLKFELSWHYKNLGNVLRREQCWSLLPSSRYCRRAEFCHANFLILQPPSPPILRCPCKEFSNHAEASSLEKRRRTHSWSDCKTSPIN